jgi:hypothetical protein
LGDENQMINDDILAIKNSILNTVGNGCEKAIKQQGASK